MKLTAIYKFKMDTEVPDGDAAIKLTSPEEVGYKKWLNHYLKHAVITFEARLAWVDGNIAVITVPAEVVDEVIDDAAEHDITAESTDLPKVLVPEEIQDDIINAVEASARPDAFTEYTVNEKGEAYVEMIVTEELQASSIQSAFILSGARVDFE